MPETNTNTTSWGLIAGNGRFPFLVLEGARSQGIDMAVIALKEEASPELEKAAKRVHWVSLGELSKTIDLMHQEGVTQAVMAGQRLGYSRGALPMSTKPKTSRMGAGSRSKSRAWTSAKPWSLLTARALPSRPWKVRMKLLPGQRESRQASHWWW